MLPPVGSIEAVRRRQVQARPAPPEPSNDGFAAPSDRPEAGCIRVAARSLSRIQQDKITAGQTTGHPAVMG